MEEAEHQIATRLYQNTAKVHFNQHTEAKGRFGKRIVYGGVVISLARALSFNGLGNAFHVAAINGGRHVAPCFAGDTVYAWSEVLEKADIPGRSDIGALRVRLVGVKNCGLRDVAVARTRRANTPKASCSISIFGSSCRVERCNQSAVRPACTAPLLSAHTLCRDPSALAIVGGGVTSVDRASVPGEIGACSR